jgi:hypothetical protein
VKSGAKIEARKSARAKLAGAVDVNIHMPNGGWIQGRLHEVSATGGVLSLDNELAEGCHVMLVFDSPAGLIKETAEMLPRHWSTRGCLQPFRFTDPGERNQRRLHRTIRHLLGKKA